MKWTFLFDLPRNFVIVAFEGPYSVTMADSMRDELVSHPKWQPGLRILVDHRKTDFTGVTTENLRIVGERHSAYNSYFDGTRMAFLMKAGRDFGLARQFALMNESYMCAKIMTFDDEQEAIYWLLESEMAKTLPSSSWTKPKPL